ncbi:30S ribosomal protein S1, chloroplastic [Tetrabaena socialis]|uniref:30S ribosomal protein S1, chloroplastic n=1 Tax=Tetrabaena socialis TaxID=47790 RepID=A0A2J7ZWI1_9CHLO|nr:30S ribosomal protein S1, chloroplastic [Tetrabaena socialis]|eukprot:PNH04633.1 30S ribosomal protein S1, chloroplastic [Tetrabaena socialis]
MMLPCRPAVAVGSGARPPLAARSFVGRCRPVVCSSTLNKSGVKEALGQLKQGAMLRNPLLVYDNAEEAGARFRLGMAAAPQEGELRAGIVHALNSYGALVDLGGHVGMLHSTNLSHERVGRTVSKHLKIGDKVKVLVIKSDGANRFDLSTKELERTLGDMLRNPQLVYDKAEETYEQLRKRQV